MKEEVLDHARPQTSVGPELGYRSLTVEVQDRSLGVEGAIPAWLRGSVLRNGPALFEYGERTVRHWFDGQAMLHRFSLNGGQVSYGNRFLRTRAYKAMRDEGRLSYSEFATDPCRSIFKRAMTVFDPKVTDNAFVSVTRLGRRHYAMTEAPMAVEFDPATLETLGYGPKAPGTFATAHPHRDPASGALVNIATHLGARSVYRFFSQALDGTISTLFSKPVTRPGYVHSFAMTQRYIAHTEFPFRVNPIEIPLKGRPFIENFRWQPERGTRILIWDRHTGEQIASTETEAGFAFHHVGAWEASNRLVLEYADHRSPGVIDALYLDKLRGDADTHPPHRQQPLLRRLTIDITSGRVESTLRSQQPIELPQIDGRRYLQPYRIVYGIGTSSENDYDTSDQLVKLDNENGDATVWSEPGCYPGEPVFVPAPRSEAEDDGVVLSLVLDAINQRSFLLVLDAGSFQEAARACAPHAIPHGIHGAFYAV
jgi:carotenoid cleavage dioxygenase-like enzyme